MYSLLILGAQVMGWASFLLIDKRQRIFRTVVPLLWFITFFLLCFGLLVAGLPVAIVATWLFIESKRMISRWEDRNKEPGRGSNSEGI